MKERYINETETINKSYIDHKKTMKKPYRTCKETTHTQYTNYTQIIERPQGNQKKTYVNQK